MLDFITYHKVTMVKTEYIVLAKGRHTDQWSRIENPKMNTQKCSQFMFYKEAEGIQ